MKRFSLITITYNSEKYLEKTLQSVVAQDFSDYEHILWDGGSTDTTLEIARSFPHLTICSGEDEGIADAMNRGASFARGEFLLHLHSDDQLAHPRVLSHVDTALRHHPDVEWLYGRVHLIDEKGGHLKTTPFEPYSPRRLRKYNFISHPATFVSRRLFNQVGGFQKSLRYCMDYDLWLRLASLTIPYPLFSVIASFREHANSLSTSLPLKVADEAYRVRNTYVKSYWERYRSYRTWKRRRCKCCKSCES